MKFLRVLVVLFVSIQPIYADVEAIEWSVEESTVQVDIYVTSWCPCCKKAIEYLDSKGIEYNKYDIEEDFSAAERKNNIAPNYSGIPLAVINGAIIKGFSEERYSDALEN